MDFAPVGCDRVRISFSAASSASFASLTACTKAIAVEGLRSSTLVRVSVHFLVVPGTRDEGFMR